MSRVDLAQIMNPKSVAVIGASRDPDKVGHVILQNYINAGYDGELYPVNKSGEDILGLKTYKNVDQIKKSVDLAVIAIPAPFVPGVLEECGKAGVRSVVVVSGGFAEVGNTELEEKIGQIAMKYKMPMIGPNCLGVMDPRSRVDTLFLPTYKLSRPSIGGVSFMAQSGAVGSTILDLISGEGFGLSKFISYGNATYVDEADILEYLMNDKDTKVIVMYLEGVKRGKAFLDVARKTAGKKPVVVLKAGKTAEGQAAAHSHTAALAGDFETYLALFRQFGFIIADDLSDLLYYAKVLVSEPPPKGNHVAVITNGGGAGVLVTDALASSPNLKMGVFSATAQKALRKAMPSIVSIRNPLDLAGDADYQRYGTAIEALRNDPGIDMFVVVALFQTPGADSKLAAELVRFKDNMDKPMIVVSVGAQYTEMHKVLMESAGLPVYDSPAAAVKALSALLSYNVYKNRKR